MRFHEIGYKRKMERDCYICDLKQVKRISKVLCLDREKENQLVQITKSYLDSCDKTKTNPEIMGDIWKRILPVLTLKDPYDKTKSYYNQLLISMEEQLMTKILFSKDPLELALKLSITGNLIDFASRHSFNEETLLYMIEHVDEINVSLDHSRDLFKQLETAHSLLYLGDNCGEIVIDKCFIKTLKLYYPHLDVTYGVRGNTIVNDVTIHDAKEVNMEEVANIISNGDGSLGTVLDKTSDEFQACFSTSDIVIAKGQGNYEGLRYVDKKNVYFLFMAKCDVIASSIGVTQMDIVCGKKDER